MLEQSNSIPDLSLPPSWLKHLILVCAVVKDAMLTKHAKPNIEFILAGDPADNTYLVRMVSVKQNRAPPM